MRKRFFAIAIAISLAVIIAVAAVAPVLATQKPGNSNWKPKSNHANVVLSLPPGSGALAGRPTELVLIPYDYDQSMNFADVLIVNIWLSSMNSYIPIAAIGDQAPNAQIKSLWNNTAVYLEINGVVIRNNLITVSDSQLDVWLEGHGAAENLVFMTNLTVPVPLDFTGLPSAVFGSSLTIPAMTLMFRGVGDGFPHEETTAFPSGYSYVSTHTDIPAWVLVTIPAWIGASAATVSGTIIYRETITNIPPA